MKNFIAISCLSIMLVTFTMAEETPKTPGISVAEMFKLRQMYDDLQKNSKNDFTFTMRPNEICFKNNERNEEVCIHKAILAEMILEAVKAGQTQILADFEKILTSFKQADLPEFNVGLKANYPPVCFDKNYKPIIDPNNKPSLNIIAATPTRSFAVEFNSETATDGKEFLRGTFHKDGKIDVNAEAEYDLKTDEFNDLMLRMKNLKPKN